MAPLGARNLYVMPSGGTRTVTVYSGDPFAQIRSFEAATDSFMAVSAGNKTYVIGRSANNTIATFDGANVTLRNLSQGATGAVTTPDGRRLLVLAGSLRVIDTSSDTELASVNVGTTIVDIAVSHDSARAYVLASPFGGPPYQINAVDLNSNTIVSTVGVPGIPSGIAVGPNGLLYVPANNRLYEYDGRGSLTQRGNDGIIFNGTPMGKPLFTPDGTKALVLNNTPFTGGAIYVIDLANRTVTAGSIGGASFSSVLIDSNFRAFGLAGGTLYSIQFGATPTITQASIGGLASVTNIAAVAMSNETPQARYLYLTSSNIVTRVDLNTNSVSGSFTQAVISANTASFTGPPYTGTLAGIQLFGNGQTIAPGATSLPILARVVDGFGRPLQGAFTSFTTSAPGATILSATTITGADGYAMASVLAPVTVGVFNVQITVTAGVTVAQAYTLVVGTTGGSTGGLSILSGNGQVVRDNNALTPEPLRVSLRDSSGNPIAGAQIFWARTSGPGNVQSTSTVTDATGVASTFFISGAIGGANYSSSTVTATSGVVSINFSVTTVLNTFGMISLAPNLILIRPGDESTITTTAQTTLPAQFQIRAATSIGPSPDTPLPNVGMRITTGSDTTIGPGGNCSTPEPLTDANGLASCDLVVGRRIGSTPLTLRVGGGPTTGRDYNFTLVVTPGLPAVMRIVRGDQQTGAPGQTTPLALRAEIRDVGDNLLTGVPVNWEIVSGSGTLSNVVTRSDAQGAVSAFVRFGSAPGNVVVRVVALTGSASATFTLTNQVAALALQKISGDNQSAVVGTAFSDPLVVRLVDANSNGIPQAAVVFSVTSGGNATISGTNLVTDSTGRAQVTVVAGPNAGTVTVQASTGGFSQTFTLTIRPLGPTVSSVVNGATFGPGISPCSIAILTGTNIVPSLNGVINANSFYGPLPTTHQGVQVSFAGNLSPIFWVGNVGGREQVAFQVPCDLQPGPALATLRVNDNTASLDITIARFSPGIFETRDSAGRLQAVAQRPDGSYVSEENPARRGEMIRFFVTGIGQTNPQIITNRVGAPGQMVTAQIITGLNNAGVRTVSAEYVMGLIGVYAVTFEVPQDTNTGSGRPFAVAVVGLDGPIFGNGTTLPVQ